MKRVLAGILVLALAVSLWGCIGDIFSVKVDYGDSKRFTRSDLNDAVWEIKKEFLSFTDCKLNSLTYAGDEESEKNLPYIQRLSKGEDMIACIVFYSSFQSPEEQLDAWMPNTEYTYHWLVGQDADGDWHLVTFGY